MKWDTIEMHKEYVTSNNKFVFTLKKRSQGVYGGGEAYLLSVRAINETKPIYLAAFWTSPDGYNTLEKRSVDGKKWEIVFGIKKRAEKILKQHRYLD